MSSPATLTADRSSSWLLRQRIGKQPFGAKLIGKQLIYCWRRSLHHRSRIKRIDNKPSNDDDDNDNARSLRPVGSV